MLGTYCQKVIGCFAAIWCRETLNYLHVNYELNSICIFFPRHPVIIELSASQTLLFYHLDV